MRKTFLTLTLAVLLIGGSMTDAKTLEQPF